MKNNFVSKIFLLITPIVFVCNSCFSSAAMHQPQNNEQINEIINGETYRITNVMASKSLRPYNALKNDGNKIILYNSHCLKCMTWKFNKISDNKYLLQNVYTGKSFIPNGECQEGATCVQQVTSSSPLQVWEFTLLENGHYNIKLSGTDLYLSAISDELNSLPVLMSNKNLKGQEWILVKQHPLF